jgi:hypothetical protein
MVHLVKHQSIAVKLHDCYLCGKPLEDSFNPDHIIPNALFIEDDPNRPQLYVHPSCNTRKSKEDEWFIKQLQLRCSSNMEMENAHIVFLNKAIGEKNDAYMLDKHPRNFVLAKGIAQTLRPGIQFVYRSRVFQKLDVDEESVQRFEKYIEKMCEGLFRFNIPSSNPPKPELNLKQYVYLDAKGELEDFITKITELIQSSGEAKFHQRWRDRILYCGTQTKESEDKGFVYIQFFNQLGILAWFM